MKRMLNAYKKQKLDITDRRLVRGLYLRNLNDFDEQLKNQSKVSLMDRMIGSGLPLNSSPRMLTKEEE